MMNSMMNPIDLATNSVNNNYATHWDVTILAYGFLWVCHIEHMDPTTMLALTVLDKKAGSFKLRGRCKDAKVNANKMYEIASMFGHCEKICSREHYLNICKWAKETHKRNAGETAEQLVRDFYGLEMYWYKDSTPGKVAGDMIVNGVHIQHKHQNATFAH